MAISIAKKPEIQPASLPKISGLRRYMVLRAHPISLFWDAATAIWAVYLLWQHLWQYTVLLVVIERGFTWMMTQSVDSDALARTIFGKMALLHLHPVNFTLQLSGALLGIWGLWTHETVTILTALSLIFLGHTFGWGEIHRSLDRSYSLKPLA
jgi:hypothetical protein